MSRRSTPQAKTDEQAFPVRVRVLTPQSGFFKLGSDNDVWNWLRRSLGLGNFATASRRTSFGDAMEVHFRCLEDATAFLERFPELALADGTMSEINTSPYADSGPREAGRACKTYSHSGRQDALRQMFAPAPFTDLTGNLQPQPHVFRDDLAPIARRRGEGVQLVLARWGMPTPPQRLIGKALDEGVTSIVDTRAPHWRRWHAPASRCLVPFDSFAQQDPRNADGRRVWFRITDGRPAFFAGIWTSWTSIRKVEDGETTDQLFAILAADAKGDVAAIEAAMPVVLTCPSDWRTWLMAPWSEAKLLQRAVSSAILEMA